MRCIGPELERTYTFNMKRRFLRYFKENLNSIVIQAATHLMALMAAVRGMQVYKDVQMPMLTVLIPFGFLLLIQKIVYKQAKWVSIVYILIQTAMVTALYIIAPYADYWALLLFPASVFVMKRFHKLTGYFFILLFMVNISSMISIAEKEAAIEFIPIYIVGFLLISSFSIVLQQTTDAKEEAEDLSRMLSSANKQLRQYTERAARLAILEERTAIARDLHDSATQTLFSANLLLSSLGQNYVIEEKMQSDINKISTLTQTAMRQLRSLIKELKPGKNLPGNFYVELNSYIHDLKQNHAFIVHFKKNDVDLPIIYRSGLLNIIREGLHNSMKHSGVSEAFLSIDETPDCWKVLIKDEGKGFDDSESGDTSGLGLENMRTRCLQLGGQFEIVSSHNRGTTIEIKIVKDEESQDEE